MNNMLSGYETIEMPDTPGEPKRYVPSWYSTTSEAEAQGAALGMRPKKRR